MKNNSTDTSLFAMGVLALWLAVFSGQAFAEVDDLVKQARTLLEKNQAKQAFELLEPQEAARAGDPDFDTTIGIAANETEQFTRAVFALERVLSVQPENSRARAELGRALFAVGDNAAARKVLLETKKDNIPPEAAATIDKFLQAIDRSDEAAKSSIKTYIETSLGYDTNINSGPGNANVAVPAFGGLIFTLNNANLSTKDNFATLGVGVSARRVLDPRWSLIGNLSANGRMHGQNKAFDATQVDGNAGASYRYDKHEFSGVVQAGSYYVNAAKARDQAGLVGEWTYRMNGEQQWSSYVQWGQLSYPGQAVRDAIRTVIGTSYAHGFRSGLLLFTGAYVGTEKQKNGAFPNLGHKLYGIRTGAQQMLSEEVSLFGGLSYENRKYGGQDALFLVSRRDNQFNLNLGLNWVPARLWKVTPQLSWTSVKSNVPTSAFNRTAFAVTLRRDF
jgi:outer membrane protein